MLVRMWTRMWYDQNEMQQLLGKYVDDLLRINSCLFYVDHYFRKNFDYVTFLRGEYKSLLHNTRLVTRDH